MLNALLGSRSCAEGVLPTTLDYPFIFDALTYDELVRILLSPFMFFPMSLGVIKGVCRGVGRGVLRGVPMGVFLQDIIGVTESSIGQLHRDRITSLSFWSGSDN